MGRIRRHLTFANVASALALFIAISGGTAVALNGTNTVQSDDLGPGAQVKAPDVAAGAVGSAAVANESLTGQDIKNRSGVDTCQTPLTAKFGPICAGSDAGARFWAAARNYCASFDLRLPSFSEAFTLARRNDVPGVGAGQYFWTDEEMYQNGYLMETVSDDGTTSLENPNNLNQTVCVTDPSA